jgi:putative membrane protein
MKFISIGLTAFVALLHSGFLAMEMFFWTTPFVRERFGLSAEFAEETVAMAANQGLYNGFLVAGLLWGLLAKRRDVKTFFLLCVIVAGAFGALSVKPSIFVIQSVPAILALGALWFAKSEKP